MSSEEISLFSIRNINGIFATRADTFFTEASMTGTATTSSSISVSAAINWSLGVFESIKEKWVGLADLITNPDLYELTWLPEMSSTTVSKVENLTNGGATWYRTNKFNLDNGYLMTEDDEINMAWYIEAEGAQVGSVDTSSWSVSFDIFNEMDYPQYEPYTHTYDFSVGIAQ